MSLGPLPSSAPIADKATGNVNPMWNAWLSALFGVAKPLGGNGTTANRPTNGLYIGLQYFDATLGLPVFVKSLNPTVWVNAAGGVV
jgi:hypothetical protein